MTTFGTEMIVFRSQVRYPITPADPLWGSSEAAVMQSRILDRKYVRHSKIYASIVSKQTALQAADR
jgi:hypothetical protein